MTERQGRAKIKLTRSCYDTHHTHTPWKIWTWEADVALFMSTICPFMDMFAFGSEGV